MKFNIPQLCVIAALVGSSSNKSPTVSIDRMEGGFCKALLMRKADGTEVVAKLSTKMAAPDM